ncbi:MAG: tRNA uridine(34) 5-carboxymethylaminomethyl modification radical SAM/GNAT enzyme Elp3 [Polyangiaceae bacterium]|nr:tRNA uridine(34) 5-carboxymethylaminomethyl modification radical SAM/GNAT enzyme Elp3 [Polyangiaceae bacterium]
MKKTSWLSSERYAPERYEEQLGALLGELRSAPELDARSLHRIVSRHPKAGGGFFSKSELVWAARRYAAQHPGQQDHDAFIAKIRSKPIRTQSGVTPLTVLTEPYPCPGRCVFCPNDPRAPKSYLAGEPGAQRAARFGYDAYAQANARIRALYLMGHPVDKVELIVLGGTWTAYPAGYRVRFISECLRALNDFDTRTSPTVDPSATVDTEPPVGPLEKRMTVDEYNRAVRGQPTTCENDDPGSGSAWAELEQLHRANESSQCRCIGLSVETRPDHVDLAAALEMRRLGVTRVQIGCQSLSDRILDLNRRGHTVGDTASAIGLLRRCGFKIQAHWMSNLLGATPDSDRADFARLFADPAVRPDELKIYPCALVHSSELVDAYERGEYFPYSAEKLVELLSSCLREVPEYCRVNRIIRDIPGTDLLVGERVNGLRHRVEAEMARRGWPARDIRSREVRTTEVSLAEPRLDVFPYDTATSRELFLQFIDSDKLLGFARLGLPTKEGPIEELGRSALLREVHVYGQSARLGERPASAVQHMGLGARLVEEAARLASAAGFCDLAVISAVGTRRYYRRLGFVDGELYQHRSLEARSAP